MKPWVEPGIGIAAGTALAVLAVSLGLGDALANLTAVAAIGLGMLACARFVLRRLQAAVLSPDIAGAAAECPWLGGRGGAKSQFEALQSANDAGNLQRLRECMTPAMFELAQEAWRARDGAVQHVQVFGLEAEVELATAATGQHVLSVRFTGRVRGQASEVPADLDETWHLTRPADGRGGWLLAGIQQSPQPGTAGSATARRDAA